MNKSTVIRLLSVKYCDVFPNVPIYSFDSGLVQYDLDEVCFNSNCIITHKGQIMACSATDKSVIGPTC